MNHFWYSLHDAGGKHVCNVHATVLPRKDDVLSFTRGDFRVTLVRIMYEQERDAIVERFVVAAVRI